MTSTESQINSKIQLPKSENFRAWNFGIICNLDIDICNFND